MSMLHVTRHTSHVTRHTLCRSDMQLRTLLRQVVDKNVQFLVTCRPLAVGMGNAIREFKNEIERFHKCALLHHTSHVTRHTSHVTQDDAERHFRVCKELFQEHMQLVRPPLCG